MKAHFKSLFQRAKDKIEKVNTLDIWNNQVAHTARVSDLDKSLFFEFDAQFTSTGNGVQEGNGIIRVHATQLAYVDTLQGGKDDAGYNPFVVLDWIDDVQTALQGFSGNDDEGFQLFTSLDRSSLVMDTDHEGLHHTIIEYKCVLIDRVSKRDRDYTDVTPWNPNVIYEKPIERE